MDLVNNLNTFVSLIIGILALGANIFSATIYLRTKVSSSQKKQTAQLQTAQQYQFVPKQLTTLDWMEVIWKGLEDACAAKDGGGWMNAVGTGVIGSIITLFAAQIASDTLHSNVYPLFLTIFYVLFFTVIILFCVYFVGRRIEEKVEEMNRPLAQKSKRIQNY